MRAWQLRPTSDSARRAWTQELLAPALHFRGGMADNTRGKPSSYDDIVRKTTIEPDSSVRPSRAQEQAAREGYRALDDDERALQDRVTSALSSSTGVAWSDVTVEVTRDLVTLRGRVGDAASLRSLEDVVARIPGVETVHNQVVVAAPQRG